MSKYQRLIVGDRVAILKNGRIVWRPLPSFKFRAMQFVRSYETLNLSYN